ncbi:MAG: glycosyltransferase family 4 protein [Cyanobium sp. CZS 25K]|nr:glycosyltransferase family 4 protein [Cyanobium sp. CZS25K]
MIPYGVSLPSTTTRFRSDPFRVVFSGRIWEHQKRATLVIQALISACQLSGAIRASMIGDGHARAACERLVADAGLSEAITFTGPLAPDQVKARLLDAQAILLMSDFEGLPIALLEAMAAGALRRLSDDPALWRRCSAAARDLVAERYNADGSYLDWRQLLQELDQQFRGAASSPYSIDCRSIDSLRRLDPRFHQEYKQPLLQTARLRQSLHTTLAMAKHRLKTALGRLS